MPAIRRASIVFLVCFLGATPQLRSAACGPGDSDGDGVSDLAEDVDGSEDCDDDDSDSDGVPDYLDIDDDGDSILTAVEVGRNTDADVQPDYLDSDSDGDSVPDDIEANDADADGVADVSASGNDTDGDGLDDTWDTDNGGTGASLPDTDDDGLKNYVDADDDDDGIPTTDEDANGNGDPTDDDTDGDGTPDFLDATDDSCTWFPDCDGDGAFGTTTIVSPCSEEEALLDDAACFGNDNAHRPYAVSEVGSSPPDCDDFDADAQVLDCSGICGGNDSSCEVFEDGFESGDVNAWT